MMNKDVHYNGGGFTVTQSMLRTTRKTYDLDEIQFVSVQRGLLLFVLVPAVAGILFVMRFFHYLYFFTEVVPLVLVCAAAIYVASQVGTLRVRSFALNDEEESNSFGLMRDLVPVRAAVEKAIMARKGKGA